MHAALDTSSFRSDRSRIFRFRLPVLVPLDWLLIIDKAYVNITTNEKDEAYVRVIDRSRNFFVGRQIVRSASPRLVFALQPQVVIWPNALLLSQIAIEL